MRVRDVEIAPADFAAMSSLWKRYVYTVPPDTSMLKLMQSQPSSSPRLATIWSKCDDGQRQELSPLIAFCRKTLQNSAGASSVERLDLDTMQRAASVLEGTHDFASFQSKGGRKTTVPHFTHLLIRSRALA